jgi:hypothetical protein
MRRFSRLLAVPIIAGVLLSGSIRTVAQEDSSKPKPAARVYPPLVGVSGDQDTDSDKQSTANLTPDTRPLTGVQTPTLGTPEIRHSYWIPGFEYSNFARSSSPYQPTTSNWNTTSYLVGNLSLLETWNRSQLAVNYSGGGSVSTDPLQGNNYYHQLGFVQAFNWERWQLIFIDQFSYLPQAQFGFGVSSNLATPGIGGPLQPALPGLQTNYQPNQSILTSLGPRYSNSITTQVAYDISPRGSVTLSGSYGILRFVQTGNIDTNDSIFSIGYNYALSQKDAIGVLYRFSGYRYIGDPQAFNSHAALLAYGHKVTGRLALQLFGGPEVTTFRVPVNNKSDRTSVAGGGGVTYASPRTGLSITYNHGVSGGSGQLAGASADQLQNSINYQLSRVWQGNLTLGFARNTSLGLSGTSQVSQTYDSWFAGGGISRPLGRTANFTFGYTAYIQSSRLPVCVVSACSTSYVQHQLSLGFQWHARPLVLR